MTLRVLISQLDSTEESQGSSQAAPDDSSTSVEDPQEEEDSHGGDLPAGLDELDFADEDEDEDEEEEEDPWFQDPSQLIDIDEDQGFIDFEVSEDLATYPVTLNSHQRGCAQVLRECCIDPHSSEEHLLQAYHGLVLSIFTTSPGNPPLGPLHSLVHAFIISTSIDIEQRFSPPHLISPYVSKMIYAALFSILKEVIEMPDPYQ